MIIVFLDKRGRQRCIKAAEKSRRGCWSGNECFKSGKEFVPAKRWRVVPSKIIEVITE